MWHFTALLYADTVDLIAFFVFSHVVSHLVVIVDRKDKNGARFLVNSHPEVIHGRWKFPHIAEFYDENRMLK